LQSAAIELSGTAAGAAAEVVSDMQLAAHLKRFWLKGVHCGQQLKLVIFCVLTSPAGNRFLHRELSVQQIAPATCALT